VSNYAKQLKVKPKYVRKYVITKMHLLDLDSDTVRFLIGHSIGDVHTQSYFNVHAKVDKEYRKYAEWLRQFLKDYIVKPLFYFDGRNGQD